MIRRFVHDDAGYLAWLKAHPAGFVLNTYPHVTSAYLVLHRVACGTINRRLAAGRTWTDLYGKTCDDDRTAIERWAIEQTGKPVKPCGHCLPGADGAVATVTTKPGGGSGHGPRAPRTDDCRVEFTGGPVCIRIEPDPKASPSMPPLVIEGAQWLAETFCKCDPSAVGTDSFDSWIANTHEDAGRLYRLVDEDITAVNRTMAARTSHKAWAPIIAKGDATWLCNLDPEWDLFEMSDEAWAAAGVSSLLRKAFEATKRPTLKLAVITKVLHIKRPRLIPVMDSVVMLQIGAPVSDDIDTWVHAVEEVRRIGRANLEELRTIQSNLDARGYPGRSLVRILDALLWVSSPGSGLFRYLADWERVLRPRTSDGAEPDGAAG